MRWRYPATRWRWIARTEFQLGIGWIGISAESPMLVSRVRPEAPARRVEVPAESITNTVKTHAVTLLLVSVAVHVTMVVPTGRCR